MAGIVESPILMQEPSLASHFLEKRRAGIRCQDVERGAFETVLFDPVNRLLEDVRSVVIESQDETAVHLDAAAMEDLHAPRIVVGSRTLLVRRGNIIVFQRFKTHED